MVLKGEDPKMARIKQADRPDQRVLMNIPMPPFSRIRRDQPRSRHIP
jgi:hypothetical protein